MPKLPLIYAALAAAMIVPNVAKARPKSTVVEEKLIDRCIRRSARGKAWLEQALSALRDQEGGWIGAQVQNRNGSYDLGPMQINSWWVIRFANILHRSPSHVQHLLKKNACFNVEAARYILLNELDRSGNIWIAIGRYHSRVWWRQRPYVVAVSAHFHP